MERKEQNRLLAYKHKLALRITQALLAVIIVAVLGAATTLRAGRDGSGGPRILGLMFLIPPAAISFLFAIVEMTCILLRSGHRGINSIVSRIIDGIIALGWAICTILAFVIRATHPWSERRIGWGSERSDGLFFSGAALSIIAVGFQIFTFVWSVKEAMLRLNARR